MADASTLKPAEAGTNASQPQDAQTPQQGQPQATQPVQDAVQAQAASQAQPQTAQPAPTQDGVQAQQPGQQPQASYGQPQQQWA
ncbi:MAG: hypothetical protein II543_01265, partial [Desulfovibrio sp.]|nr:hypothetical protein [Desulfovibrio sp.]